jgi:hypothetical protein
MLGSAIGKEMATACFTKERGVLMSNYFKGVGTGLL